MTTLTPEQLAGQIYKEADLKGIADLITDLAAVKKLCLEYEERLTKAERERDEALRQVEQLKRDKERLSTQLTHPTIHLEYYKWLSKNKDSDFVIKHCPIFEDFHAIAMWVWSVSREIAAESANRQ